MSAGPCDGTSRSMTVRSSLDIPHQPGHAETGHPETTATTPSLRVRYRRVVDRAFRRRTASDCSRKRSRGSAERRTTATNVRRHRCTDVPRRRGCDLGLVPRSRCQWPKHGSTLDHACAWPNETTSPVPTLTDRSGAHPAKLVGSRPNTCQALSTTPTRSSSRVRARAIPRSSRCAPFRHPRTRRGRRPAPLPLPSPLPPLPMATVDDIGAPPPTRCRAGSRTSSRPHRHPRLPRSANRRTERPAQSE